MRLLNDKYRKARGGYSRLLEISCSSCDTFLFKYQKDGPGILKRLYIDRITPRIEEKTIVCPNCKAEIGSRNTYKKENRPIYLLVPGTIKKKIVKLH